MTYENLQKLLVEEGYLEIEPTPTAQDILNDLRGGE
jgi:hypothetical protein